MIEPGDIKSEADFRQALKEREARLEAILKRARPAVYRYVVPVDLGAVAAPTPPAWTAFPQARGSQVVKKGTTFFVESMEVTYTVSGTDGAGAAAVINYGAPLRSAFISFQFKVRDTGSDQEWQNDWIPGNLLLTANENVAEFSRVVSGGSEIIVDVDAVYNGPSTSLTGLTAVSNHQLKFSFVGREVAR